jgi:hypothetical protein
VRHAIEILSLIAVSVSIWIGGWLVYRNHASAKIAGFIAAGWSLFRVDSKRILGFLWKGYAVNLKSIISNALSGLLVKALPNPTPAAQAVVAAAVEANTQLALLFIEQEGAKLLAANHPELATALTSVLGPIVGA